jgi:hypothetical protein
MKPVFDTNILIDYLAGHLPARQELDRYASARIAIVTWIEVMVGVKDKNEEAITREFLNSFETIPLDQHVAESAVQLRRQYRLRLPDAVIWASAKSRDSLLITRNTRDYPQSEPDIRVPYAL